MPSSTAMHIQTQPRNGLESKVEFQKFSFIDASSPNAAMGTLGKQILIVYIDNYYQIDSIRYGKNEYKLPTYVYTVYAYINIFIL